MLKMLRRPMVSGLFFALSIAIQLMIVHPDGLLAYLAPALAIAAYLIAGLDVLFNAFRNILRGQVFDENFLMSIATVGALALREFHEAAAVMLFFQVGEAFQQYAVGKSRRSISDLMDIRPDYANVYANSDFHGDENDGGHLPSGETRGGEVRRVSPDEVKPGDIIIIRPGERVPLDAVVISGVSSLDTSALTGESRPREVEPGDELLSGCINQSGLLEARVTKAFGDSTVNRILDLIENASSKKSVSENFITRFARYYTPSVVILAALVAVLPPLVMSGQAFGTWIQRALIFLVVSCPCALVISVPLSFFGGIGGASRRGVLVKGSNYLDALSKASTVVFDKTGTLTRGVFEVQKLSPAPGIDENRLLYLAAHAEAFSTHPISVSIRRALMREPDLSIIQDVKEIAGHGVSATVDGVRVLAGNRRLMESKGISFEAEEVGTVVFVAADGEFLGSISIADAPKPDAKAAISSLAEVGVTRTAMLTGDSDFAGQSVAKELGISRAYTQLLPQDKIEKIEEMFAEKHSGKLVFVGDGINDAPVLARADVGIAMGALGSDAAIEAADVVIMDDKPSKVADAIRIARKTVGIANQNIVFALTVKVAVLVLAVLGISTMWFAIFADVGVSVLAILNAMRALKN